MNLLKIFYKDILKDYEPKFKFKEDFIDIMKKIIFFSIDSIKKTINPNNRKCCFEIFGYDFIMDSELKIWLIEVNTNPCIELSSPILEKLIPRMLGL